MEKMFSYIFSEPSVLFVIAVIFLILGSSITYFMMKPDADYVNKLKKENNDLRQTKNKLLQILEDYQEADGNVQKKR